MTLLIKVDDSIHVSSIELDISKKRTHQGENWYRAHEELSREGSRMLIPSEFTEFLEYTKKYYLEIFKDIIRPRSWSAEHLDAYFEQRDDGIYVLTRNKTQEEKLDGDTLMEDGRILLESWISNPTSQGFPRSNVEGGSLCYHAPRDGCVARFGAEPGDAILFLNRNPLKGYADLGVRTAKPRE